MDQICLDPQDKLLPTPATPRTHCQQNIPPQDKKVSAPPPPRIISGTALTPGHRNAAEIVGAVLVFVANLFGPSYRRAMENVLQRRKQRSAFGQQYEIYN